MPSSKEKFSDKSYCSPNAEFKDNSCFSKNSLVKIAENIERKKKVKINKGLNKKELWKLIKKYLSDHCDEKTEVCWITHPVMEDMLKIEDTLYTDDQDNLGTEKDKILNHTFKPPKPKGKYSWLSTIDIEKVMNQYEKIKWRNDEQFNFSFIGPVPIDFDYKDSLGRCVSDELCNLNIKSLLSKGIKYIGIVFNLDPHYKPGIHWVSMFIDLIDQKIEYFDSFGVAPPNEVNILVNRCIENCKKYNINLTFKWNDIEIQKNNSECGIYSIYFILKRLTGQSFHDLVKELKKIKSADKLMNSLRDIYFVNSKLYNLKNKETY